MLQTLLELRGRTAITARTGAEALRVLRSRGADIILRDLGLPGMSGYVFAHAVRQDAALRAVPLVAVTGYGQRGDRQRTAEAGFEDHLVKPVILRTLDEVLGRLAAGQGQTRGRKNKDHHEPG